MQRIEGKPHAITYFSRNLKGVIKDCLAALCETPNTWNTRLDYVRLVLNTAFHRSANNQPLYLLMGVECTARDAAVTGTEKCQRRTHGSQQKNEGHSRTKGGIFDIT